MLILKAETDLDRFKVETFERMVEEKSISFNLRSFSEWCRSQGIQYEYKFFWRKDYPITANIWNAFTVLLWKVENHFL